MKMISNGITIEVFSPADIAFYKKAGYREVPKELPEEPTEVAPTKPKKNQAGKKSGEKAVTDGAA